MNRPLNLWIVFGLCLVMILPAMIWLTYKATELDRRRREDREHTEQARREAELQEKITSALYRMDWKLGPHIAREAARPWYLYQPFYEVPVTNRNIQQAAAPWKPSSVPSPLLYQQSEFVHLHFQITPDGRYSSPQRPIGESACQQALLCCGINEQAIRNRDRQLQQVKQFCSFQALNQIVPPEVQFLDSSSDDADVARQAPQQTYAPQQLESFEQTMGEAIAGKPMPGSSVDDAGSPKPRQAWGATERGGKEFLKRQQSYSVNTIQWVDNNRSIGLAYPISQQQTERVVEGVMRPIWIGDELVLARRTLIEGQHVLQCCWLDWNMIQEELRDEVADILPDVRFEPVLDQQDLVPGRALVTLPAQVVVDLPDPVAATADPAGSAVSGLQIALWLAWCGLFLSTSAVGVLLFGVIRLSERRASFVSAVTHELRTPLTTFKMYSEMLADDMVPSPKRRAYATTLQAQADRLGHLVENVLQFARLERGIKEPRRERIMVSELLERVSSSLQERARQAGMEIRMQLSDETGLEEVDLQPQTIEQILYNLVDNACKYARASEPAAIDITVQKSARWLEFVVRDYGPGVNGDGRKRLFRPFCKSDQEAANSAPGVGLGLALCQRMARSLDGRLEFQNVQPGARFALKVPRCG